jgi:hypothetical protein
MAVEDTDNSADNIDDDIQLEDMEVTAEELEQIESPKEDLESDDKEESLEDESDEESDESTEEESDEQSDDTNVEPTEEEKQKAFNKEMAEKRIQAKQQRENAIKQEQNNYVTESESDEQAVIRQLQVEAYNTKVEGLTNKLANGYERAIKDFPILVDSTPEVQAEINEAIDAFQDRYVKIDSYGNPTELKADLYQYLQTKAISIERLTAIGARKQVDSKAKEKSKTLTPPVRTPKTTKIDPDLAAFNEEAYS